MSKPTQDQINEQQSLALESIEKGRSKFPDLTYEDGVNDTILWLAGNSAAAPMEE